MRIRTISTKSCFIRIKIFQSNEYEEHLYDRKCSAGVCKELLTFTIDNGICTGCGLCVKKCAVDAIVGEKGQAHYIIDDKCVKCGMCYEVPAAIILISNITS